MEKRKLRKQWQNTRLPQDKATLNKAVKELKQLLHDEKQAIQTYLASLSATEATDYSLWKATKCLKQPQTPIPPLWTSGGEWVKSDMQKANLLAKHFETFLSHTPPRCHKPKNGQSYLPLPPLACHTLPSKHLS
jgi:hypothetical protein